MGQESLFWILNSEYKKDIYLPDYIGSGFPCPILEINHSLKLPANTLWTL